MKTFDHWKSEELELQLGLNRIKKHPVLQNWLASSYHATEVELISVERLRLHLENNVEYWNEDELKFFFISPLLNIVDFVTEHYKPFTQRNLSAKVMGLSGKEIELKGRVEFIVAQGKQDPRHPYFFVHEYKQEARRDNDPLGQLLAAMVAAQHKNKDENMESIFGCYVTGRFWFFVVLIGNDYSVSPAYDATKIEDIAAIFAYIQAAKGFIDSHFKK